MPRSLSSKLCLSLKIAKSHKSWYPNDGTLYTPEISRILIRISVHSNQNEPWNSIQLQEYSTNVLIRKLDDQRILIKFYKITEKVWIYLKYLRAHIVQKPFRACFFYFCLPLFHVAFQCRPYNNFKKILNWFFAHENLKNRPQKLLKIGPNLFLQSSSTYSLQPKIDFSYYK